MDNAKIKEILLDIEPSELDFTVIMTGKDSKRVNGLYKPDTREILLHNKNFKTDNQLIYTAIHEYTHHLINEQDIIANGGKEPPHCATPMLSGQSSMLSLKLQNRKATTSWT